MKSDIHSALASVGEVAAFGWSLLELLLTRILPLFGFLVGQLLLHCCLLVAAVFTPPASVAADRRRRRPLKLTRANELRQQQQQQPHERGRQQGYGDLNLPKPTAAAHFIEEILNELELQEQPQRASLQAAIAAPEAPSEEEIHLPQEPHDLKASDAQTADLRRPSPPPSEEEQSSMPAAAAELLHVARSTLSDAEALDDGPKQKVGQPSDLYWNEQAQPSDLPIVQEDDAGANDKEVKVGHVEESETLERLARGSMKRRPFTRVLPPSLSQIKRTLMQRSRRASLSPPLKPSSPNLKRQSPRVRKLASTMKPSASYDNFVRNFRKHFLLDSTSPTPSHL